jgi:hypothetical protein
MKTEDFFNLAMSGELSELDTLNIVEFLTDGFNEKKLNLLCNDFDMYLLLADEKYEASFTREDVLRRMDEYEQKGKEIPLLDNKAYKPYTISDFFETTQSEKNISINMADGQKRSSVNHVKSKAPKENVLDKKKLMDPHGIDFFCIYQLRNLLVELKRKHTRDVYKFGDNKNHADYTEPINWLKSEQSLRLMIKALEQNGLIQRADTEATMQHFTVNGIEPDQTVLKPINWLKSNALLAYLIEKLTTKPNRFDRFMDSEKKWQMVKLHFVINGKVISRSLVHDLKQSAYPNGSIGIDSIINSLPID